MRVLRPRLLALAAPLLLAFGWTQALTSCTSSEPSASMPLPCAVDAVLAAHCQSCHGASPTYGAPMALVTFEDLHAPAKSDPSKTVFQLVETRIYDDAAPMPQPPNPRLSAADIETLDNWVNAGAPASTSSATCALPDAGTPDTGGNLSCTPDTFVRPASPWAMPEDESDVYVCYGMDIPVSGARQTIAFRPHIDNKTIVHHVLLYQSDTAYTGIPQPCNPSIVKNKLLYAWAPGGEPFELPAEAGYPMSGTAHYIVQTHYNNLMHLSGQEDASGFDLCTTSDLRPNEADVVAFGAMDFTIPAHGSLDITCDYQVPASVPELHVMSVFPHMHELGTRIRTSATPAAGGADVGLGGVDDWSFANQLWFPMSATFGPKDMIHTRCAWNNTTGAPVSFGEYTEDEMCYSFTMYWPRVDAFKAWLFPSLMSTCKPTPP